MPTKEDFKATALSIISGRYSDLQLNKAAEILSDLIDELDAVGENTLAGKCISARDLIRDAIQIV